jgi:uncharacterized cofD-like protein
VSFTDTNLFAKYEDGHILSEEHLIDEPPHDGKMRIVEIYLKPKAHANPEAVEAIRKADIIVIGPGDLYTSLLPNLLVEGIAESITKSKAKKVYIVNLMTKYGQTYNFTARDHVRAIQQSIGIVPDYAVINNSPVPTKALALYAKFNETPVVDDLKDSDTLKIVRADLISRQFTDKPKSDTLVRSLIRHDSMKLARVLMSII